MHGYNSCSVYLLRSGSSKRRQRRKGPRPPNPGGMHSPDSRFGHPVCGWRSLAMQLER